MMKFVKKIIKTFFMMFFMLPISIFFLIVCINLLIRSTYNLVLMSIFFLMGFYFAYFLVIIVNIIRENIKELKNEKKKKKEDM